MNPVNEPSKSKLTSSVNSNTIPDTTKDPVISHEPDIVNDPVNYGTL